MGICCRVELFTKTGIRYGFGTDKGAVMDVKALLKIVLERIESLPKGLGYSVRM